MRLSLGVQTLYEVTVPEQKRFVNDGDAWHFSARTAISEGGIFHP